MKSKYKGKAVAPVYPFQVVAVETATVTGRHFIIK
jgi:hypothetical protein